MNRVVLPDSSIQNMAQYVTEMIDYRKHDQSFDMELMLHLIRSAHYEADEVRLGAYIVGDTIYNRSSGFSFHLRGKFQAKPTIWFNEVCRDAESGMGLKFALARHLDRRQIWPMPVGMGEYLETPTRLGHPDTGIQGDSRLEDYAHCIASHSCGRKVELIRIGPDCSGLLCRHCLLRITFNSTIKTYRELTKELNRRFSTADTPKEA